MQAPLFSIITVVYNGAELLPGTLDSVRRQTFTDYESIVVDGASKDNTVEIIRQYAERIPQLRWQSEPDHGLYDAMNKGLALANGRYVWFLNCGDHLHDPTTLDRVARLVPNDDAPGVLYGDTRLVNDDRQPLGLMSELSTRSLPERLSWRDYLGGMRVVHQSFVARRDLAPPYEPDNLCADYDWCIKILKNSKRVVNTHLVLTDYLAGGLSKQKHRQSLHDRFAVMRRHFGLAATVAAHAWIVVRAGLHRLNRMAKARY